MESTEYLADKISKTLTGLCPAFSDSNASTCVWHGCSCAITNGKCICVQLETSECNDGNWKQLAFVAKFHKEEARKSNILRDAMLEIRDK